MVRRRGIAIEMIIYGIIAVTVLLVVIAVAPKFSALFKKIAGSEIDKYKPKKLNVPNSVETCLYTDGMANLESVGGESFEIRLAALKKGEQKFKIEVNRPGQSKSIICKQGDWIMVPKEYSCCEDKSTNLCIQLLEVKMTNDGECVRAQLFGKGEWLPASYPLCMPNSQKCTDSNSLTFWWENNQKIEISLEKLHTWFGNIFVKCAEFEILADGKAICNRGSGLIGLDAGEEVVCDIGSPSFKVHLDRCDTGNNMVQISVYKVNSGRGGGGGSAG
ncbi:MAG: hypothetical protein QXJ50_03995 [Candidatus Woesearchaeota archaeon]